MDFPSGSGSAEGPISPDAWKRAVYRAAPARFCVEMLSPTKQGGSYSYGMRVCPLKADGTSISSKGSNSEYEVWRRWEDCLWFQETLEMEYGRMSREKRQRLFAGKGVKKNGVYIHSDEAASFESLPPGPDPHSIARDIHDFVPKLTKKGTLFRASQATIDQRYKELQALVDALFQGDVPTLVQELRASRTVTDFFGYWRRDHDLASKTRDRSHAKPRASISSSVFSMYFSASTPSFPGVPPTSSLSPPERFPTSPISRHHLRRPGSSSTSASDGSDASSAHMPLVLPPAKSPAKSNHNFSDDDMQANHDPRSSTSSRSSTSHCDLNGSLPPSSPPVIVEEVPILFGHNPHHVSDYHANDRPTSMLESLPEDSELVGGSSGKAVTLNDLPSPVRRNRKYSAGDIGANRNCQIFLTRPESFRGDDSEDSSPIEGQVLPNRNSMARSSWQSTASMTSYLAGLDISLPSPPPDVSHRSRASIASMASFMTDSSADAIIPRLDTTSQFSPSFLDSNLRRSLSSGPRQSRPMSVPEEDWLEQEVDFLDSYFYDTNGQRSFSPSMHENRTETPLGNLPSSVVSSSEHLPSLISRRDSISTVTSAETTSPISPTSPGAFTLKVAFNGSIILMRSSRSTTFEEMCQKLHDKFLRQEGIQLSRSFRVLYILPASTSSVPGREGRTRSGSFSSISTSGTAEMRPILSQQEWEDVISMAGSGKIPLRIFDPKL